jgi:P-type Ca2+ transporter type 2C
VVVFVVFKIVFMKYIPKDIMKDWYRIELSEVVNQLKVDPEQGLSEAEVERRRGEYGLNELVERGTKSPWKILWEQLTGIMIIILFVAAIISVVIGDVRDAVAILAIVILNAILGFTQEYRAEKAMAALKQLAVPVVKVRRDGHIREISARKLVPGDIILMEAGSSVPADGRVLESINLRIQEAVLTGESEPVEKSTDPIAAENITIGDRRNMVYMGTAASYGRGLVVVTSTGMNTELGRIADLIQVVGHEPTPLQRRLAQLGKGLAVAALGIVGVVFLLGLIRGEELRILLLTAISLAVAAVPEGLPAVVTIALALGAQRMLNRKALIRKLPAVETLGSVTVICSDKTGTLTQNQMTVTVIDVAGTKLDLTENLRGFSPTIDPKGMAEPTLQQQPKSIQMLLIGVALSNDAYLELDDNGQGYTTVGDPTEGALVIAAARAGLWKDRLEKELPRVAEVPFDSERKRMTTVHQIPDKEISGVLEQNLEWVIQHNQASYISFTKGAVDSLLDVSNQIWYEDRTEDLTEEWRRRIMDANNQMAANGMRVLGIAFRPRANTGQNNNQTDLEQDLIFIGMVGMIDPARPEVKDAVQVSKSAGIRPIMITGDHPLTALFIGKELDITRDNQVITGQDLANISVEQLKQVVESTSVYARVSPEHKLSIVQALQDRGHIVAMTGDGVNDAPALKKADIGVAMGITGTDVSKEASDMVLLDDNFATIVAAIEEGRRIYDNIRKFIKYTLTSNTGEIWVMLLAPFLGMPFPLLPLQILWINLVTDGLPGLALAVEPVERNTMRRPPHRPNENIFGRGLGVDILWIGILMGLVSLVMGFWAWTTGRESWQTMVFTTLTISQMGNALATRSENDSLFKIGFLSNKYMLLAVLVTFVLQMLVVYTPFMQEIFDTVPLSLGDLMISLIMSTIVFWAVEIRKRFLGGRR